jgi:hypothetical protein
LVSRHVVAVGGNGNLVGQHGGLWRKSESGSSFVLSHIVPLMKFELDACLLMLRE